MALAIRTSKPRASKSKHLAAQPGEPYSTYRHLINKRLHTLPEEIVFIIITSFFSLNLSSRRQAWLTATSLVKASPLHMGPVVSAAIMRSRKDIWASHQRDDDFDDKYWRKPGVAAAEGFGDGDAASHERRVAVFGAMHFLKGLGLRIKALRKGTIEPEYLPKFRFDDYCPFWRGKVEEEGIMNAWWYYFDQDEEL